MGEEHKEKGFVVKDKRIFSEEADDHSTGTGDEKSPPPIDEAKPQPESAQANEAERDNYPEINFVNFVISLSSSAMYHFGDFPDPATGKPEVNLVAAKQTIDILGMMQEKTQGNLDENEKNLLDGILFELRMRYVKEKEKAAGKL